MSPVVARSCGMALELRIALAEGVAVMVTGCLPQTGPVHLPDVEIVRSGNRSCPKCGMTRARRLNGSLD